MYYRVQFLERKTTEEQWARILYEMRKRLKTFRLYVHYAEDKLLFYIQCKRNPHALNTLISPLHISEACELLLPEQPSCRFTFVTGDILHQILKLATKGAKSSKVELWVEVHFGLLSRLNARFRRFSMLLPKANGWVRLSSLRWVGIEHFLSFDLAKSAQFSLEIVKPKLKVATEHVFPISTEGALNLLNRGANAALDLSRIDYFRHSLIVGQSGSGKSEFLRLAVNELYYRHATDSRGIVVIDPHGAIYESIARNIPCYHLNPLEQKIQFFEGGIKPLAASELTADLIESQLAGESPLDTRGKRVLRFVLFALYAANSMSYENVARFLNDAEFRVEIIQSIQASVVADFFETEFPELRTRFYDSAVLPILNIVGQYQLSVSSGPEVSFLEVFRKNKIIVVSIPQGRMGSKLTKLYGGTILQQLFLYSQAGMLSQPYAVMVDELPLIYTHSFNQILAEARKFGLGFWVVQQYLAQLPKEGLASLFANVSNFFCFKTNNEDAQLLAENLNLEIESYAENKSQRSHRELAAGTLVDLSRGEMISRFMIDGKYISATRLNTDISAWSGMINRGRHVNG